MFAILGEEGVHLTHKALAEPRFDLARLALFSLATTTNDEDDEDGDLLVRMVIHLEAILGEAREVLNIIHHPHLAGKQAPQNHGRAKSIQGLGMGYG